MFHGVENRQHPVHANLFLLTLISGDPALKALPALCHVGLDPVALQIRAMRKTTSVRTCWETRPNLSCDWAQVIKFRALARGYHATLVAVEEAGFWGFSPFPLLWLEEKKNPGVSRRAGTKMAVKKTAAPLREWCVPSRL